MITIMISGKQGSGKSSLAKGLAESFPKCVVTRFSNPLYDMHNRVLGVLNTYNYDLTLDKTLLQILGDWARTNVDKDVIIKCLVKDVSRYKAAGMNFVAVDDARFKKELFCLPAIKIRLECDREIRKSRCSQWRENENHISEIDLDDCLEQFDLVVDTGIRSKKETLDLVVGFINGKILEGIGAESQSTLHGRGDKEGLEISV